MKKLISVLMVIAIVFALSACSSQSNDEDLSSQQQIDQDLAPENTEPESTAPENTQEPAEQPNDETTETTEPSMEDPETSEGKTLVVYYSATGNTEGVANTIASITGADIFELVPAEPYSEDDLNWRDSDSRVVYEYENPEARVVELESTTVPDWESYDTVFIGYPIWWGIAAWPVDGFISANDFTGKTVIPFCTSSSSGLGESGDLLFDAAGTGTWLEGERFSSGTSEETIQSWLEGLGL